MANKIKILVTTPLHHIPDQKKKLDKFYNCTFLNHTSYFKINKLLESHTGWICSPSPIKLISKINYPNVKFLKFISTPSTGTSHISNEIKDDKKIKILNLSLSKKINLIKASSEYTFSLGLSLIKQISKAENFVKKGYWRNIEDKLRSHEVFNKKVGIIGFGRIGKNLKRYSKAFGMEPIVYDPNIKIKNYNSVRNLEKIKKEAEIIFVCINLVKKNIKFIDKNFFYNLKQKPFFINTSRGEVVDEKALIYALKNNLISSAALDVIAGEQKLDLHKNILAKYSLKNPEKLLITPHIAGLTFESESRAIDITIELIEKNIINFHG